MLLTYLCQILCAAFFPVRSLRSEILGLSYNAKLWRGPWPTGCLARQVIDSIVFAGSLLHALLYFATLISRYAELLIYVFLDCDFATSTLLSHSDGLASPFIAHCMHVLYVMAWSLGLSCGTKRYCLTTAWSCLTMKLCENYFHDRMLLLCGLLLHLSVKLWRGFWPTGGTMSLTPLLHVFQCAMPY